MDELIEMYLQTTLRENFQVDRELLKKHKLTENQWLKFLDLVEDLDLNEEGARILLDEVKAGRLKLK